MKKRLIINLIDTNYLEDNEEIETIKDYELKNFKRKVKITNDLELNIMTSKKLKKTLYKLNNKNIDTLLNETNRVLNLTAQKENNKIFIYQE
jgi:hypothetical protein